MSNAILVTGATGKTGSEVVKQLIGKGEAVKVAAHHTDQAGAMFGPEVEIAPFDFGRPRRSSRSCRVSIAFTCCPSLAKPRLTKHLYRLSIVRELRVCATLLS